MRALHPWNVSVDQALEIQDRLRNQVILTRTFSELKTIAGADVAYSKDGKHQFGAIAVLSFPGMEILSSATSPGEISFPYIPGLLSFREGPVLLEAYARLKAEPNLIIFDGHGIAHPRRFGLASHLGVWLDLPSIGCAKTPLINDAVLPGPWKGDFKTVRRGMEESGAVLRTRKDVNPVFVSPGHRIDLPSSIKIILQCCPKFRIPEPLRIAHQLTERTARGT
jgi:deoxyribonuclease V